MHGEDKLHTGRALEDDLVLLTAGHDAGAFIQGLEGVDELILGSRVKRAGRADDPRSGSRFGNRRGIDLVNQELIILSCVRRTDAFGNIGGGRHLRDLLEQGEGSRTGHSQEYQHDDQHHPESQCTPACIFARSLVPHAHISLFTSHRRYFGERFPCCLVYQSPVTYVNAVADSRRVHQYARPTTTRNGPTGESVGRIVVGQMDNASCRARAGGADEDHDGRRVGLL